MKRKYNDYHKYAERVIDGIDLSDEEAGYRELYKELKKVNFDVPSYRKFRGWVLESAKSQHMPIRITHGIVSDETNELARLVRSHHQAGQKWNDGSKSWSLDHDAIEDEMTKAQRYKSGKVSTLQDRFGTYNRDLSTPDFGVFDKDGKLTISFRGSKMPSLGDKQSLRDWEANFKAMSNPKKLEKMGEVDRIRTDLTKVQNHYGEAIMKRALGTGYSKGAGNGLGAMRWGEEFGFKSEAFNGHISKALDLSKLKMEHLQHFTADDPAGIMRGILKGGNPLKNPHFQTKVYGMLKKYDTAYGAHELDNFTDDVYDREGQAKIEARTKRKMADKGGGKTIGEAASEMGIPLQETEGALRHGASVLIPKLQSHSTLVRIRQQLEDADEATDRLAKNIPGGTQLKQYLKDKSSDRLRGLTGVDGKELWSWFPKKDQTEAEQAKMGWRNVDLYPDGTTEGGTELHDLADKGLPQTKFLSGAATKGLQPMEMEDPNQPPVRSSATRTSAGQSRVGGAFADSPQDARIQGQSDAYRQAVMERQVGRGNISGLYGTEPSSAYREAVINARSRIQGRVASVGTAGDARAGVQGFLSDNARGKLPMGQRTQGRLPADQSFIEKFSLMQETGSVQNQYHSFRRPTSGGAGSSSDAMPSRPDPTATPRPSNVNPQQMPSANAMQQQQTRADVAAGSGDTSVKTSLGARVPMPPTPDNQYRAGVSDYLASKSGLRLKKLDDRLKSGNFDDEYNETAKDFRKRYGRKGSAKPLEEVQEILDKGGEVPTKSLKFRRLATKERAFQKSYGVDKTRLLLSRIMELEQEARQAKGDDKALGKKELDDIVDKAETETKAYMNVEGAREHLMSKMQPDKGITDGEQARMGQASSPIESARVQSYLAAADNAPAGQSGVDVPSSVPADDARTLMGGGLDVGKYDGILSAAELKNYTNYSEATRSAIRANLDAKINTSAAAMEDNHIRPLGRSIRAGLGSTFLSGRSMVAGGLIGMGVGELDDHILRGMNQYEAGMITGGLTGVLTERATMALAGESLMGAKGIGLAGVSMAGAGRLLTAGLSSGAGLVIGEAATNAIMGAFSKNASPYTKDIVSNIAGGEIGLLGGLGVGGAVAAGAALMSGAGIEGAVAAANAWNPIGWGTAIAAAVTAIAGFFVGLFEGNKEHHEKQERKKTQAEVKYAAGVDSVKAQFDYVRTYLSEMGMGGAAMTQLDQYLGTLLKNKDVSALSGSALNNLLTSYMKKFTLSDGTYEDGEQTARQMFQQQAQEKTLAAVSGLTGLVNRLNDARPKGSPKIVVPNNGGVPWDNTSFETAYNKLLTDNQAISTKLGIKTISVESPDAIHSSLTYGSDIPLDSTTDGLGWSKDQDQIQGWETSIKEEGMLKGIMSKDYSSVWNQLTTEQPQLAPIYKVFTDVETGKAPPKEVSVPPPINLTNAQQAQYIAQWKAIAKSNPALNDVMQKLINAANEQNSMLRKPPPTTTDSMKTDVKKVVNDVAKTFEAPVKTPTTTPKSSKGDSNSEVSLTTAIPSSTKTKTTYQGSNLQQTTNKYVPTTGSLLSAGA